VDVDNKARFGAKRDPLWELALVAALMVVTFVLAATLDLSESFQRWSEANERLNIDEVVVAAFAGVCGLAVYAWRRFKDSQREARRLELTESELAVTSERYRSLFDFNPTAVFSLKPDGSFTSANRASELLCGYSEEELRTMNFAELATGSGVSAALEVFAAALEGRPQQFQTKIVHRDRHHVDLHVSAVPIVIGEEVVGVFGIAQDISARVRTLQDLAQARLHAEQASELKSVFVATVSHEIRTPLTSVLAAIEMLQDCDLDDAAAGLVDAADRGGRRLLRLVDDLLDFSELASGTAELDLVEFDPTALVSEVVERLGRSACEKDLHLTWSVDPELMSTLNGDAARISQALTALVENAVKFTERGSIRIEVRLASSAATTADVRFVVRDTGIGLAPEQQALLFESFQQVDQSTSRGYEGAGLGLAICQHVVTLMGGSIWIDSTEGVGSTVSFQLPLQHQTEAAGASLPRPSQSPVVNRRS
jgi:PAS domain S-box-containing protein